MLCQIECLLFPKKTWRAVAEKERKKTDMMYDDQEKIDGWCFIVVATTPGAPSSGTFENEDVQRVVPTVAPQLLSPNYEWAVYMIPICLFFFFQFVGD